MRSSSFLLSVLNLRMVDVAPFRACQPAVPMAGTPSERPVSSLGLRVLKRDCNTAIKDVKRRPRGIQRSREGSGIRTVERTLPQAVKDRGKRARKARFHNAAAMRLPAPTMKGGRPSRRSRANHQSYRPRREREDAVARDGKLAGLRRRRVHVGACTRPLHPFGVERDRALKRRVEVECLREGLVSVPAGERGACARWIGGLRGFPAKRHRLRLDGRAAFGVERHRDGIGREKRIR